MASMGTIGSVASLFLAGCSADFVAKTCAIDQDCPTGTVCEFQNGAAMCIYAEDAPIIIGHSGPISGPNQALGIAMKLGIELALDERNEEGGIRGRALKLKFLDDANDPIAAEAAARGLTDTVVSTSEPPACPSTATPVSDGNGKTTPVSTTALARGPNAVLAMLGNVGTETMLRAAPVAIETGTIYFSALTGAGRLLRDKAAGDCAKYIFNVRASYAQEARATVALFKKRGVPGYRNIISFDQKDAFGDEGYSGLLAAYVVEYGNFPSGSDPVTPISRFRYSRNEETSALDQAIAAQQYLDTLAQQPDPEPVGILMTDTYGPAAAFIKAIRTWQFDGRPPDSKRAMKIYFSNLSFVSANALAERLVAGGSISTPLGPIPLTQDVYVSQVVPNYQNDSSEVVVDYNRRIAVTQQAPSFPSLEGYIDAEIFLAGLLAHSGPFTPDQLIPSLESLPNIELGVGANSGFSVSSHQYSNSVWGTSITPAGAFKNVYFWTSGSPIQFFE